MAKNIAYLHDVSLTYDGGAEIATRTVIKTGRALGYNIQVIDDPMTADPEMNAAHFQPLHSYDLIILSNIWWFWPEAMNIIMDAIRTVPYVKYEHDHDGLSDKPRGREYPKADYAKKIYGNSALNVFQSPDHQRVYAESFGINGICMPPMIDVDFFKTNGVERNQNTALIGSPGKWRSWLIKEYIQQHPDIKVDVLSQGIPHEQIPALYSQYEYFVHFPRWKCPCDRVIFEAALCGCKIVINDNVETLGKDLSSIDSLREWLRKAPYLFWHEIEKIIEGQHHA